MGNHSTIFPQNSHCNIQILQILKEQKGAMEIAVKSDENNSYETLMFGP